MKNNQIRRKYNSILEAFQELDSFIPDGYVIKEIDPVTNKEGYRLTEKGIKFFKECEMMNIAKLN
jgi:predicted transcriptional regulator